MSGYMGCSCSVGECGATITTELYGDFQEMRCEYGRSMTCDEITYPEDLCLDCERSYL